MKVSKTSTLYRLASVYGRFRVYDNQADLCSYVRSILWGLWIVLSLIFVSAGIIAGISDIILTIFLDGWGSIRTLSGAAIMTILLTVPLLVPLLLILGIVLTLKYFENKRYKEPGLLKTLYRSKKEKICSIIQITN